MCNARVLHSPDFTVPFSLHCDGSHTGIGSVLMQTNSNGKENPNAFMSRKLNQSQRINTVTKKCLAAVRAEKKGLERTSKTKNSQSLPILPLSNSSCHRPI